MHLDNLKVPTVPKKPDSNIELKKQHSTKPSVDQSQDKPSVNSALIEQSRNGETPEIHTSFPSQALHHEPNQTGQELLEASNTSVDTTSEVKVTLEEANEVAEEDISPSEHEDDSKDEVPVGPNPSKNAFPESNKDLNNWQAFAKDQPCFQARASSVYNGHMLKFLVVC